MVRNQSTVIYFFFQKKKSELLRVYKVQIAYIGQVMGHCGFNRVVKGIFSLKELPCWLCLLRTSDLCLIQMHVAHKGEEVVAQMGKERILCLHFFSSCLKISLFHHNHNKKP